MLSALHGPFLCALNLLSISYHVRPSLAIAPRQDITHTQTHTYTDTPHTDTHTHRHRHTRTHKGYRTAQNFDGGKF